MANIRCRQINEADHAGIAALLSTGFPNHGRRFWERALARLSRHATPAGFPKYGYLLEADGVPVGAVLLIFSHVRSGSGTSVRCNVSSWYVAPAYRSYASLLVAKAMRHKEVTYMNVSPAPHTWPIIEAQGFSRYCAGIFIAAPIFNWRSFPGALRVMSAAAQACDTCDPFEREILLQHAALGCISVWVATPERAYPFVFRPRLVKRFLPCAQLIYCRDVEDFVRFAGPIGRFLLGRGLPIVILDSNGPIAGLAGKFRPGRMPKYFRGPQPPRLGDLAYTEYAMLGL